MNQALRVSRTLILVLPAIANVAAGADPGWVSAMRAVHAKSTGLPGTLLHLGDSITYSMAYFAPLQYAADAKMSDETRAALQLVDGYMKKDCYQWKGADKGNYSGQTAAWGLKNINRWIRDLQPEVAVVMFGTNDIRDGPPAKHARNLRALVQACLDRGVIVILTTIPPRHAHGRQVDEVVAIQRKIAADLSVPLIDFHAHVLNRRPEDWDGALERFSDHEKWQVPTIISRDGVHLSNPKEWQRDFTENALARNGNSLRSYLTALAYAEVIRVVIRGEEPGAITTRILGEKPPKPDGLPSIPTLPRQPREQRSSESQSQDWHPRAPALPEPSGAVVKVASVRELFAAVKRARHGETIMVAAGRYDMPSTLTIQTDGVALRGEGGDRTKVILDFRDSRHHEGIAISHCSDVTVADLTVRNVRQNGIKINSNKGVSRVRIYNVVGHNVWQRHVKGPSVPDQDGEPRFVRDCRIEYCLFHNDRPKRRGDEPWEDRNPRMKFNYVGGIDVMSAKGWVISDNVFTGIRGKTGEARGAIFLWINTMDCVVERNIIVDCDSGICLGNSSSRGPRRHATRVVVRNNFVVRCSEKNIEAAHTRGCRILHNSVHDPESRNGRLIRVVHANDGLIVVNNIFSGPKIVVEQVEGRIDLRSNLIRTVGDYFVNARQGDLHLTGKALDAIDKAVFLGEVRTDIDRRDRGATPDIGADELATEK
ncbi:MAG: GDSL-type esterase/lipase family protein [Planctomycetota bacterium]